MSKQDEIAAASLRTMISLASRPKMTDAMKHEYSEAAKIYGRWLVKQATKRRARKAQAALAKGATGK